MAVPIMRAYTFDAVAAGAVNVFQLATDDVTGLSVQQLNKDNAIIDYVNSPDPAGAAAYQVRLLVNNLEAGPAFFSSNSSSFADISGLSVAITPSSSSNKILVFASLQFGTNSGSGYPAFRMLRDSTEINSGTVVGSRISGILLSNIYSNDAGSGLMMNTHFLDSPATTSATTYKIQGASYNRETERFNYNYCCFDSYIDDIKKSFHSLNFELLSMNLLNWATYYNINHSNPYWKPNYLHLGIPENFNDNYEYIDSRTNIIDSCKTRTSRYFGVSIQDQFSPSWIETYDIALDNCMNVKCKEKDKCSFFKTGNHALTKLNSFDDSANIREQLESILGHILYIECYGDYELFAEFLIEHNNHIFPNRISSFLSSFKSIDDIINALIMSNFYNEELNLLSFGYNMLNNSRYWLEEKEEDKEMITNDDIKEQMLQWATERSR